MRDLERNKQVIWYSTYTGNREQITEDGKLTGEWKQVYDEPVKMRINVSPARGYAEEDVFGKDLQYDRTMVTCDMTCPIDETSILWIDSEPTDGDNAVPHNYIVTRVAKGLDSIVYAVKKVEMRK